MPSSPNCYYHPSNAIESFCLHPGCILPLCSQCVQIHRKQNNSGDHRSLIVGYLQAKQIAIDAIQKEQSNVTKIQRQFHAKFIEFRSKFMSIVEKQLWDIEEKLSNSQYSFETNKQQLKMRKQQITEGSLKDLIQHYQKGTGFQKSYSNFQIKVDAQKIRQLLADSYELKKQSASSQIESQKLITKIDELKSDSQVSYYAQEHRCITESVASSKKFKRKGIFVASSPQMKKFSSCEKMRKNGSEKNIFKCQSAHRIQSAHKSQSANNSRAMGQRMLQSKNSHEFTYSIKDISQKSMIRPHSQKRLKISNKDNMDTRFAKIMIESCNIKVDETEKWRKVVNTKDINKSSHNQSRLRLSTKQNLHEDILNPKQMRELIMKKRMKNEGDDSKMPMKQNLIVRQF